MKLTNLFSSITIKKKKKLYINFLELYSYSNDNALNNLVKIT